MPERYFEKFPLITYSNTVCKDITRRTKIEVSSLSFPFVYYPYELKHSLRSDLLSEYYYDDAEMDWLIYISNEIIDPYYDWYLDDEKFNKLLIEKYGSAEEAQKKVFVYRNNWANDDSEISPSFYNNTLAQSLKKYYTPILGVGTNIVSYKRKESNAVTNTNRILEYTISANNNSNTFVIGEIVDFKATGTDATVGTGELVSANTTSIRVKNVLNDVSANTTDIKDIVGETTFANVSVNSSSIIFENFTNAEGVYWSPVYYYDYELEINEQKKNLYLVDENLSSLFVEEFTAKIQSDIDENGFSN